VFLGRNKNRWDELYDKERHERIEEHRVGGLAEVDARKFLEAAATYHRDHGDSITADNLQQHADAILVAACEQRKEDQPFSFHPYYLDLAYGILYDRGVHFQPADLGQTPAELQIRFLRYLQIGQPDVFQAFCCLALAGIIDKSLFNYLIEQGCIARSLHFEAITVEDYSYIEEISDMPGTFRLHRLMELALIKNQSAKPEDRAVARQHIDVILGYFKKEAAFSKLADCSPERHLRAYQKGMTIPFDRHDDGLFDFTSLKAFFFTLEEPFDFQAFVSIRIGWWSKLCELHPRHHAKKHPDVAQGLNNLAMLYYAQGQYARAEPLYQRSLGICEKALGPEHPNVATSLNNLAGLYSDQGRYAEAEPLLQRSLSIREKALGPEHPNVALNLNNLAGLYSTKAATPRPNPSTNDPWRSAKALGPEHPNMALCLENYALCLRAMDRSTEAAPMEARALAIRAKST
jgi:tetratricopeptide (TPR) repeat protein